MIIHTNWERAYDAFQLLMRAYRERAYPFDQPEVRLPQDDENMPKTLVRGSRDHASYLLSSCYWMRGGIRSGTAFQLLSNFYDAYPHYFNSDDWKSIVPEKLARDLGEARLGFQANFISNAWKENSRRISERHAGDTVGLVRGVTTYEEACARIKNQGKGTGLLGFQEKMVSMLVYFLLDARFIDPFAFPVPVDFHVSRIILANELIVVENAPKGDHYKTELLDAIRVLVLRFSIETNTDVIEFCNALWLYSQWMCAKYAGNESLQLSGAGRQTVIIPAPRWTLAQTRAFYLSCGRCVLSKTCKWSVPSMNYYITGKLILREPRETPPQRHLFGEFV